MAHVLRTESGADFELGDGIEPTTLNTHKNDVASMNAAKLDALADPKVTVFLANDSGEPALLTQLQASCQARARLELKVGAQVILLKNVSIAERLCNGSIGQITRFSGPHKYPVVRFAFDGNEVLIQPETWMLKVSVPIVQTEARVWYSV